MKDGKLLMDKRLRASKQAKVRETGGVFGRTRLIIKALSAKARGAFGDWNMKL